MRGYARSAVISSTRLLSFEAVDAVRCAIEVQNGMVDRNAGLPPERRIEFRVGIHLGDVVEESDGDLMGDGVNIAARLVSPAANPRPRVVALTPYRTPRRGQCRAAPLPPAHHCRPHDRRAWQVAHRNHRAQRRVLTRAHARGNGLQTARLREAPLGYRSVTVPSWGDGVGASGQRALSLSQPLGEQRHGLR